MVSTGTGVKRHRRDWSILGAGLPPSPSWSDHPATSPNDESGPTAVGGTAPEAAVGVGRRPFDSQLTGPAGKLRSVPRPVPTARGSTGEAGMNAGMDQEDCPMKRLRSRKAVLVDILLAAVALVCWALAPEGRRINRAGFDRIKDGMTRAEVEAILGAPPGDYTARKV